MNPNGANTIFSSSASFWLLKCWKRIHTRQWIALEPSRLGFFSTHVYKCPSISHAWMCTPVRFYYFPAKQQPQRSRSCNWTSLLSTQNSENGFKSSFQTSHLVHQTNCRLFLTAAVFLLRDSLWKQFLGLCAPHGKAKDVILSSQSFQYLHRLGRNSASLCS